MLAGSGRVKLDDEIRELSRLDAIRVAPEVIRSFEAGPNGIELLAFGAPRTGPAAEDAQPMPNWWSN